MIGKQKKHWKRQNQIICHNSNKTIFSSYNSVICQLKFNTLTVFYSWCWAVCHIYNCIKMSIIQKKKKKMLFTCMEKWHWSKTDWKHFYIKWIMLVPSFEIRFLTFFSLLMKIRFISFSGKIFFYLCYIMALVYQFEDTAFLFFFFFPFSFILAWWFLFV